MSEALRQLIDDHAARVAPTETEANLAYWDFTTTGKAECGERFARLRVALRRVYADPQAFEQLVGLTDGQPIDDPLLARQATLLRYEFLGHQMDEETIEDLTRREVTIESVFNTFRANLSGKRVTENELIEVLRESNDPVLCRQAWEAGKQIGGQVADQLLELVDRRNLVSRRIGFDNYYRMHLALQELDEAELFAVFDELDEQVSPIYGDYKANLDAGLADRFSTTPEKLRPWHYHDLFFQEAPAADAVVRQFLSDAYADQEVEALTERFYHAIGLEVGDVLARSDLYEREGKSQHAYCVHIDRKEDVRVLGNIKPNNRWMDTMLHECGHAAYDKYLDDGLPYLLRQPAHTLFTEAVAMLMGRLAVDVDWLVTYAGMTPGEARSLADRLRRHQQGGLLITSRWVLVMCHFERALYQDPGQDLNRLWWDLVERFQLMSRPEGRDAPDWAAKIHLSTVPVYYHNYLMGELVASQLRHQIDTTVLSGNGNSGRRFVTEAAVGQYFIEKVFRPGGTRHWQDALMFATGERLRPAYFVAQVGGGSCQ